MERRVLQQTRSRVTVEKRDGDKPVIVGYAAVFYRAGDAGTEYELWGNAVERIMPGAFDRAIRERDDAAGLFNHDPNLLLARVSSGTLRLSVDAVGLRYEITPGDTSVARDVIEHIRRQDVTGSSFAFDVTSVTWLIEGDREVRQINEVQLWDVAPVVYPAYSGTTSELRAAGDTNSARAERDRWRKNGEVAPAHFLRAARVREIEAGLL